MKRTAALAPLSRDHHVALVVARDLTRAEAASSREAAERFVAFMAEHGLDHFRLEEALLVPAAGDDPHARPLIDRMLDDHAHLRTAWRTLRTLNGAPDVESLREIGTRLAQHVRMEERELFPHLEESLPEPELQEIGRRVELGASALAEEPPVTVVRRFLRAFIDRDLAGLREVSDPDVEIRPLRLTGRGGYRGHGELPRWLGDIARAPVEPEFVVQELQPLDGGRVAARVLVSAGGESVRAIALFVLAQGRVREVQGYISDEEMLTFIGAL